VLRSFVITIDVTGRFRDLAVVNNHEAATRMVANLMIFLFCPSQLVLKTVSFIARMIVAFSFDGLIRGLIWGSNDMTWRGKILLPVTMAIRSCVRTTRHVRNYIQSSRIGSVMFLRKFNDFAGRHGHVPYRNDVRFRRMSRQLML
jgi:hypothetical protein